MHSIVLLKWGTKNPCYYVNAICNPKILQIRTKVAVVTMSLRLPEIMDVKHDDSRENKIILHLNIQDRSKKHRS